MEISSSSQWKKILFYLIVYKIPSPTTEITVKRSLISPLKKKKKMFLIDFSVCASKWAGWLVMTPRTSVAWRSCSTLCGRKLQGELCACALSHRTGKAVGLDGRVWWEIGNQTLSAVGLFQQAESRLGPWGSQLEDAALVEEFAVGRQGEVTAP